MKTFLDAYYEAPQEIIDFLYSDDFYSFYDEYVKKFEMNEEEALRFIYLLQDLAIKRIDYEKENVLEIIKQNLNYDDEKARQLEYHIKSRFLPLIEPLWKEQQEKEEEIKIKKATQEKEIIKKPTKEVIDLIEKKKEEGPQKILNLQKIIQPKTEELKKSALDLSKIQEIKTEIPKSTVDIKQTVSWEPPKPSEEISSKIVVIKKPKQEKKGEEGVIDLSNL